MLKVKKVTLNNNVLLAPLAGVTDVGFRMLCKEYGAGLTYTEMVSAKGLHYNSQNTASLLAVDDIESPSAVQLFGSEPDIIAEAVGNPLLSGFDIIDINMGCPVEKIVKCGEGSALMKTPKLASEIIKAAVSAAAGRPVTVKLRLGYNEVTAPAFSEMCQAAGASMITIHGRTRSMMYGGKADYAPIKDAVRAVTIPVIVNGDIKTREDYLSALEYTNAAGVMIGRACLGKPYVFSEILGLPYSTNVCDMVERHIGRLLISLPERIVTLNMRKHIGWYFNKLKGGKEVKERCNHAQSTAELREILNDYRRKYPD